MRFTDGLFVVDWRSAEDEFDEWFILFVGDNGGDRILRLRRDDTRVGTTSAFGEVAGGGGWRGDERLKAILSYWAEQ